MSTKLNSTVNDILSAISDLENAIQDAREVAYEDESQQSAEVYQSLCEVEDFVRAAYSKLNSVA
jgi:uncharacterized protein YgfB (UPF0149 family)